MMHLTILVGGFNPFEKYSSNWIISPRIGVVFLHWLITSPKSGNFPTSRFNSEREVKRCNASCHLAAFLSPNWTTGFSMNVPHLNIRKTGGWIHHFQDPKGDVKKPLNKNDIWQNPVLLLMVQKSGVHQLSLVVFPMIYKVSAPSQVVVWDFFTINSIIPDFLFSIWGLGFLAKKSSLKIVFFLAKKNLRLMEATINHWFPLIRPY